MGHKVRVDEDEEEEYERGSDEDVHGQGMRRSPSHQG